MLTCAKGRTRDKEQQIEVKDKFIWFKGVSISLNLIYF